MTLGVALSLFGVVQAQETGYSIDWWNADGSAATSTAGSYALTGVSGQADAGTLDGGNYQVTGSFWGGAENPAAPARNQQLFLPLLRK